MKRTSLRLVVLGCAVSAVVGAVSNASVAQEHSAPHWSYTGRDGPDHWAELDKGYSACGLGHRQSPIDIRNPKPADLPPVQFDYRPSPLHIINNGHTIQINYAPGSFITVGDTRYQLAQFHFHHPSEERINGKVHEMVAHLVHIGAGGKLAVVAVLLDPGAEDPATASVWTHLPSHEGPEQAFDDIQFDIRSMLPKDHGYYTFSGSLTTPPCTEDVTWYVLKTPKRISKRLADTFGRIYPRDARPTQPLYGREVLASK